MHYRQRQLKISAVPRLIWQRSYFTQQVALGFSFKAVLLIHIQCWQVSLSRNHTGLWFSAAVLERFPCALIFMAGTAPVGTPAATVCIHLCFTVFLTLNHCFFLHTKGSPLCTDNMEHGRSMQNNHHIIITITAPRVSLRTTVNIIFLNICIISFWDKNSYMHVKSSENT